MATFVLDGEEIEFQPGETIMKAAWRQGKEIPHYCWHPGLSIAANCRMCLVEVKAERVPQMPVLQWDESKQDYVPQTKPKLVPACQQVATEGMDVRCDSSEFAQAAQKSTHEFLLLNHPVDCPICDQAGECKLQDYWYDHQGTLKRKVTEPVHKPKAVRFGETIVYDAERCVMCTRCVRFCDEIVGDHVLDMRERGNKNEIVLSPGRELDHNYTLMTEHVCPVGALTSRDFRFKARVWFLRTAETVCPGCATGCNSYADYDPRDNRLHRLRPRDNAQVNDYWMCDDGMLTYKVVNENRVADAASASSQGQLATVSIERAKRSALSRLRNVSGQSIAIVLSASHSDEDNFALLKFAQLNLPKAQFFVAANTGWQGDKIIRDEDNNPNRKGVARIAPAAKPLESLPAAIAQDEVKGAIFLGSTGSDAGLASALQKLPVRIVLATHHNELTASATEVLPIPVHFEVAGTFTNKQGRQQRFEQVVAAQEGIRPVWELLSEWADQFGKPLGYRSVQDVRAAMTRQSSLPPKEVGV